MTPSAAAKPRCCSAGTCVVDPRERGARERGCCLAGREQRGRIVVGLLELHCAAMRCGTMTSDLVLTQPAQRCRRPTLAGDECLHRERCRVRIARGAVPAVAVAVTGEPPKALFGCGL